MQAPNIVMLTPWRFIYYYHYYFAAKLKTNVQFYQTRRDRKRDFMAQRPRRGGARTLDMLLKPPGT